MLASKRPICRVRSQSTGCIEEFCRERTLGGSVDLLKKQSPRVSTKNSKQRTDWSYGKAVDVPVSTFQYRTSDPSQASVNSEVYRATKSANKNRIRRLQHEHQKAILRLKAGRRRSWSSGEIKTRAGRLIRSVTNIWYSLFDNQTYVVVNQQETTFRFNESKSLFLFDRESKIRQFCINLFIRPVFSHFIMLVILANCVCMMLAEPPLWIENYLEHVFTAIYCFEAIVKIIGRGFVLHSFSYLRDPWNWLDFIVIVFALITTLLKDLLGQFSVLRAFRVLRALKTMSVVPGLRGIVKALLRSIRALQDVIVLTIFCVSVFALVGYQLFSGTLRNKCVLIPGTLSIGPDAMYMVNMNILQSSENFSHSASIFNINISDHSQQNEQYLRSSNAETPYTLTPLYNTPFIEGTRGEENVNILDVHWNEEDANFTATVFSYINETLTEKYTNKPPKFIKTNNNRETTCNNLFDECVVHETIKIPINTESSILQVVTSTIIIQPSEGVVDTLFCDSVENVSMKQQAADVSHDKSTTSFTQLYNPQNNKTTTVPYFCNITVRVSAGNISCIREKLDLAIDATNHTCDDAKWWLNILTFAEKNTSRWESRKSLVYFQLIPNSDSVEENMHHTTKRNASKSSNNWIGFLILEENQRKDMDDASEKKWDCSEKNYIMRSIDSGMYFYVNSSNRPGREPLYCSSGESSVCPPGYECKQAGGNPDFGYTNFDHFFWAFLTSFRLIAQDAWSRLFYLTLHTIGKSYVVFYIFVMFLGSYYLINLILAVVYMAYEEQQAVVEDEEIEEAENKSELREVGSEENSGRTQDEESGSKCDSVRSGYASEERRKFGLITTSLTSINDSSGIRMRRHSSRRSRYGHRRPPTRVDQESEYLYLQYTRRYGDGLSKEHLENIQPDKNHKICERRQSQKRQDSMVSESSEQSVSKDYRHRLHNCHGVELLPLNRQRESENENENTGTDESSRKQRLNSHKFTPESPLYRTETSPSQSGFIFQYSETMPDPVDTTLRNSTLDVIPVNFEIRRSPSIYSSESEISVKVTDSVAPTQLPFCDECRRKQNQSRKYSDSENRPTVFVDSSLEIDQDELKNENNICLSALPYDSKNQVCGSVSTTSGLNEATEQVVCADISPSSRLLSLPSTKEASKKKLHSSASTGWTPAPAPKEVSQRKKQKESTSDTLTEFNSNEMNMPLKVPSLLVTSASSEHIAAVSNRTEKSRKLENNMENSVVSTPANFYRSNDTKDLNESDKSALDELEEAASNFQKQQCKRRNKYDEYHVIPSYGSSAFHKVDDSCELQMVKVYQDDVTTTPEIVTENRKPFKQVVQQYYANIKRGFVNIFCKWTCCTPQWGQFQSFVKSLVLDPFMDLFITSCIFLNTVFMMAEYHPMPRAHEDLLEQANLAFTIVFTAEMSLKVLGLGPYTYFREAWNVFDAIVVISSLLEIVLKTIPGLSVLRTFRLMRILKLAKSWPTLNKLLRIIGRTLGKLWHLTLVFLLVLFIFAVVGMQLLREKYKEEFGENMPRWNFDNFPHAFMVVFRIQCGEWIENMFTCMNVASAGICIPLFILVLVIGNLVILNLFLALLLNSFSGDALQRTDAEPNSLAEAWQRIVCWITKARTSLGNCNIVTNCCNKLQLQLCMGEQVTSRSKKVEETKKAKQMGRSQEIMSSDQLLLKSRISSQLETKIKTNFENNKQDLILVKKDNIRSDTLNNKKNGRSKESYLVMQNIHRRHHTYHGVSRDLRKPKSTKCPVCHKNQSQRPTRKRREKEGFALASSFQNRTDSPVQSHSSASHCEHIDDETRPPRQAFKANIEYTRISSEDRTRGAHENRVGGISKYSDDLKDSISERKLHRSYTQIGERVKGKSFVPDPILFKGSDSKTRKYSGAEEMDVILNNSNPKQALLTKQKNFENRDCDDSGRRRSSSFLSTHNQSFSSFCINKENNAKIDEDQEKIQENQIQQCFPPFWVSNTEGKFWSIRLMFYNIAIHRYFENMVIFFILLSSIALAFEDIYLPDKPAMGRVLDVLDKFFCVFFTIEMLIKWIGYGIRYYITNGWCILDLIIVFFSLLDLGLSLTGGASEQLASLRVLRTFRALRPLRALSRFQGMKVVVDALVRAIPSIFHVFLVCIIVWLIFSILGVNLFGGRFGRCVLFTGTSGVILPRPYNSSNSSIILELSDMCLPNLTFPLNDSFIPAVRDKFECLECARLMNTSLIQWVIPSINFDNVGQGFLALMQVATFKGWLEIMANAIDITGIEQQPSYEVSFENYVYFCIFIIFGAFFSLNLFIGVIIDNFNQQKVKCADGEDGVFLTDEQKRYYNAMKRMAAKAPSKPIPRPSSWFANKIYDLVTDRKFEIVVMVMILLNMVVMAVEHYDMSQEMSDVLGNFNLFFICIFFVEAVLKLIGLRWYYFTVPWNVFDIIVVLVSIIASALSDAIEKYFVQPTLFRIIRLFRVTRILRLIREAKGIRTLLFALMMSIPALFNIGSLLFLVIFIYAILGMSQFAYVQKIAGVDDLLNFETFPNSFLVLFQVSTSEGWNTFIEPILRDKPPFCDPDIPNRTGNGNCGNATVGVIYFVTYVLITFLIVINMYIAIILENFEVATRESSEPLTADDFEQFFEVWQRYDDRLSQYITFEQLQHLLHHLDFPLRVTFPNQAFIANARMKITPNGRIHCLEVIIALIKKVLGDSPELDSFKDAMLQSFNLKWRKKEPLEEEETIDTMEFVKRRRSAIIIQKAYRKYMCEPVEPDI